MLKEYLAQLKIVAAQGVAETSGYPALKALFDEVGKTLSPKVVGVNHPNTEGRDIPDFGLYVTTQIRQGSPNTPPERGAVEVKGVKANLDDVIASLQVKKYREKYGQCLVTNYMEFALVLADGTVAERHKIEDDSKNSEERLKLFLQRALTAQATLTRPQDVARFLASYAQEAKLDLEDNDKIAALKPLRESLEASLGIKFGDDAAERFFRSTLVQTLFYGVFSAWVLWHEDNPSRTDEFDWDKARHYLHVPVIQELYDRLSSPLTLGKLGITQYLKRAGDTLTRVDRKVFFDQFESGSAVQYFYEPFLEAFDPELRKQMGVWYTPREIVEYMVERVHQVLQSELGIANGLADERVVVLDPCCGTGAYLVGVLNKISQIHAAQGAGATSLMKLEEAATKRIFGFELLPAPFVVAHLQVGLLLQKLGAPLKEQDRAGIYLTNALTGWEPAEGAHKQLPYPELSEERDHADQVKQGGKILVILGNPPYNGYAGIAMEEERTLSDAYRTVENPAVPAPQGQGLNDLYVRFFRMAERQIAERSKDGGVVCYISNYSWLDGLSHTAMRERYLKVFDKIWVDNLNGDKYSTGKTTPDGRPDPSVFSTEFNREGIQVGTGIGLMVRGMLPVSPPDVRYRDWWGTKKREEILASVKDGARPADYVSLSPEAAIGLPLKPRRVGANYLSWPTVEELIPWSSPGVTTGRDGFVSDIDQKSLDRRIEDYLNPNFTDSEIASKYPLAFRASSGYNPSSVRLSLLADSGGTGIIYPWAYRPFDTRYLYWESQTSLLDRKRSDLVANVRAGNIAFVATQRDRLGYQPPYATPRLGSYNLIERACNCFLLFLAPTDTVEGQVDMFAMCHWNLSGRARGTLAEMGISTEDFPLSEAEGAQGREAANLFFHALAVMHAPAYAEENEGALRQDWPRIPVGDSISNASASALTPKSPLPSQMGEGISELRIKLAKSAEIGRRVAALLDPEKGVSGVTEGEILAWLRSIRLALVDGGNLRPGDLEVTAGWGHAGQGGVVMPARGRVVAGDGLVDVYLNDRVYVAGVPEAVWKYTLGGYQVVKKWLSYRESVLLGRALRLDEAEYLVTMCRRIAALVAMRDELDANYAAWR